MSLKDGKKKMSKSEISDLSRINLKDDESLIINKIKKAKTDTLPMPTKLDELRKRPEVNNLLIIYSSIKDISLEDTIKEFSRKNFSNFKEDLSQSINDKIGPITKEIKKLLNDKNYLDKILQEGCIKASEIASKKIKKIHEIVGF